MIYTDENLWKATKDNGKVREKKDQKQERGMKRKREDGNRERNKDKVRKNNGG